MKQSKIDKGCLPTAVAYSSAPNERYLWNKYLLDPVGGFDGEGVGEQNISQVEITHLNNKIQVVIYITN